MSTLNLAATHRRNGHCPSYFRARCIDAANGGRVGYDDAGYHLGRHIEDEFPYSVAVDEWEKNLDQLSELLEDRDNAGVIDWCSQWLPSCIGLVPPRRRANFVKGVYRAFVHTGRINEDE